MTKCGSPHGANAYDCSPRGDELLKLSEQKAKSELVNLIASAAGAYTGAVISQIFDAVLAPGVHSQFGSEKNSQFKPER